jgi:hypothetical protein
MSRRQHTQQRETSFVHHKCLGLCHAGTQLRQNGAEKERRRKIRGARSFLHTVHTEEEGREEHGTRNQSRKRVSLAYPIGAASSSTGEADDAVIPGSGYGRRSAGRGGQEESHSDNGATWQAAAGRRKGA